MELFIFAQKYKNMIPLSMGILKWLGLALACVLIIACAVLYFKYCNKVARYAQDKGLSYWVFYLLSLFLTPFIGYFISNMLYVEEEEDEKVSEEKEAK